MQEGKINIFYFVVVSLLLIVSVTLISGCQEDIQSVNYATMMSDNVDDNEVSDEVGSTLILDDAEEEFEINYENIECSINTDCSENEYCSNNTCELLECDTCQHIENQECISYECCENEDCEDDQVCKGRECKTFDCGSCKYAEDHKCVKYECCKDSDCEDNYRCKNNECVECRTNNDCGEYMLCKDNVCMTAEEIGLVKRLFCKTHLDCEPCCHFFMRVQDGLNIGTGTCANKNYNCQDYNYDCHSTLKEAVVKDKFCKCINNQCVTEEVEY